MIVNYLQDLYSGHQVPVQSAVRSGGSGLLGWFKYEPVRMDQVQCQLPIPISGETVASAGETSRLEIGKPGGRRQVVKEAPDSACPISSIGSLQHLEVIALLLELCGLESDVQPEKPLL